VAEIDETELPLVTAGRDVAIGSEADGWVEVRSGVEEDEAVATTGSFLLKSELLRGTMSGGE